MSFKEDSFSLFKLVVSFGVTIRPLFNSSNSFSSLDDILISGIDFLFSFLKLFLMFSKLDFSNSLGTDLKR